MIVDPSRGPEWTYLRYYRPSSLGAGGPRPLDRRRQARSFGRGFGLGLDVVLGVISGLIVSIVLGLWLGDYGPGWIVRFVLSLLVACGLVALVHLFKREPIRTA
ncbi:MAG TPA: hypothetical protein VKF14_15505 [Candidatus Dormibacteraeota bacterium]|nr:hypothetical protein [Candidatus Dormibacteraeota bacterium]